MTDLNLVYDTIIQRHHEYEEKFKADTRIRLWDGNWNLVSEITGEYQHSFKFINNDAGHASLQLPLDHAVSDAMASPENWPTKSMYLTFDKDGARWSGRIASSKVTVNYKGDQYLELNAIHDYQKLKELLVWANPFLPAEVQFPKAWVLFGPARWAVATTLLVNLIRKNNSLWMLPDDPMDIGQWVDLDMSGWNIAVKPVSLFDDSSLTATVTSRFKSFHDCVKDIVADAQLSIEVRRFLPGDSQPIPLMNLRHGCLVVEVVDKSGWNKETAWGGNLINGLTRGIQRVLADGLTEDLEYVPRVTQPDEYFQRGFFGSLPSAPWVVLEHGPYTGMESTEYEYVPPGPSQFVTGGSSMPGVNEVIKASVIGLGGVLGSMFLGQSQLGATAEALLEPLYSDVFMAFMAHKYHDRIQQQGWDFPFEHWTDGADKAYTLQALSALRKAKYETRERRSVKVKMNNGAPYWVGAPGYGDFFIGDRVAVHALGMPEDVLMVEQVQELEYTSSPDDRGWEIVLGKPEYETGLSYLAQRMEQTTAGLKELGIW